MGWKVLTIWECALKGPRKLALEGVAQQAHGFIVARDKNLVDLTIQGSVGRQMQPKRK